MKQLNLNLELTVAHHLSQPEAKEQKAKDTYTPRTYGAAPVQLEFDFGPEFACCACEVIYEFNSESNPSMALAPPLGSSNSRKNHNEK